MKKNLFFLICFVVTFLSAGAREWNDIARDFRNPPMCMHPTPLWFWNNAAVEPEELRRQMGDFKKAGYGGLSILPFGRNFRPEYLTEAYFEAYKVCIEEAERLGITLCIYDEYGFPSGTAGDINGDGNGRFRAKYPGHTNKRLDKKEYLPEKGKTLCVKLPDKYLMAVVAMDTVSCKRLDLSGSVRGNLLTWNAPAGAWKVMAFYCSDAGNSIVDYLSPEAADLFIGMTHEAYYKRFSKYFGATINGTFFDEPTMYYADGRTWTPDLNDKFEKEYGFSPALYYPALWYDIGEETAEARNYLYGFRSRLFAEGYIKRVNDWSRNHGIYATGHLDNEEIVNAVGTSGDFMKAFQYLDIPGIDKIGGNRPTEKFYKLIVSAAYNWDHSYVMSETYGNMGNINWNRIFGIAMDQYAKGINMLIPHAVWYDTEKVAFRPELSQRNSIYRDSLPVFNNYLSRLNVMMRNEGRWMGDIAILYPIHTMQSGHRMDGPLGYYKGGVALSDMDYADLSADLSDVLGYDHLFIHPEVLDGRCSVGGGRLKLKNKVQHNAFSTLFVPSCETISLTNLEKIRDFARSGGTVVFTTRMPSRATRSEDDGALGTILEELKIRENVFFIEKPSVENLRRAMESLSEGYMLKFIADPVRNICKSYGKRNLWFLANPGAAVKRPEFVLNGRFDLEVWDPHTGTISDKGLTVSYVEGKTRVKTELPPCRALFIVEK